MECDNLFEKDGIRVGYTDDTVTITEIGYGRKAVFDNRGNVLSSTFPQDGLEFATRYFKRTYHMVEGARRIDRRLDHA